MAGFKILKALTPKLILQLARDLWCSIRCSVICSPIGFQKITNEPVMVVAPHPDDETFGCGGLIQMKRAAGVPLRVVIITDGEAVAESLSEPPEAVIAARRLETLNAAHRLGVEADSVRWLHLPDGKLPHPGQPGFDAAAGALLAEIKAFAPGEIYCPHFEDVHADHIATSHLTKQAVRLWGQPCPAFYYPVWAWYHAPFGLRKRLNPTGAWRLDISGILAKKIHAMAAYLDAPKTSLGHRFCGSLPPAFLRIFRRRYEVYFPAPAEAPLKILFFSPASGVYGSERSMLTMLRARQFEAEVVCPGGGELEHELLQLGIKVHPVLFGKYAALENPLWHADFYFQVRRILKQSRPDLIVINLDGNTPLITIASVWAGIPLIRFSRFEFKPPTRWLDRWCWHQAAVILCPSELVRQQVQAWTGKEHNHRVLRFYDAYTGHAATLNEVTTFRQNFRLGDAPLIGYIGRLDRAKLIETAVAALALVRKRVATARLLIIGADNGSPNEYAYKLELQHQAEALGIGEAITFTGYRQAQDMPVAFAALNVCVLPSESESFGMVLMEAWAQGVPTVASNIGGCSEITRSSGGGYLAPVGDAGAFAEHLLALLTHPAAATAMGEKGKVWVEQNCSSSAYAAVFESVAKAYRKHH